MKTVGISSPLNSSGLRRALDALGDIFDVRFEERSFGTNGGLDAWILHEEDSESLQHIAHCKLPCYAVLRDDQLISCGSSTVIDFSKNVFTSVFVGKQIKADEAADFKSLPLIFKDMTVIASKARHPIWVMDGSNGHQHFYVSSSIPELNDGESLFQYFHGKQFLRLLPLFLFLRSLTDDPRWEQPSLKACFMFDDPNLHWSTYGFIDFALIAEHAKANNYHVCFATIPLDTWFVHKPTALLFQQNRNHLSLLIHGNNHIANELGRVQSDETLQNNLRQALTRINKFELRSGIEVSKVMAPPHGACSEKALGEMAHLGFEAASISRGSLYHHNSGAPWLHILGMRPSDIIAGLPVLPRFPLYKSCHNSILIAALLHQPIIAMGHHQDLAEGLQLITDLSAFVNSLGVVHWSDMTGISRSHYAQKREGTSLWIRMFTKRIEVYVPEGIEQIWVEQPFRHGVESMQFVWKGTAWKTHFANKPLPVLPGQRLEISSELPPIFNGSNKERNLHLWPTVRRQLTETRDRLLPTLKLISRF